jgi:CheY-like chemotaxis protein
LLTGSPEERLQQLGELAASVAHGLNNLLGAVAGQSSQLLAATDGDDDAIVVRAGGLRLIHQAALDGANLAQRLLRASRGEAQDGLADLELLDLGRVLVDAVELTRLHWQDEAQQRGITLELAVEVSQPLLIRGVAADLREIVVNVILNAVDAMPNGGQLTLRGDCQDGMVTVSCQDTGLGMTPDVLARIFEPFFTTKGTAGTGMGMAIVYGVVARHGGAVQVSSTVGGGSTVTLQLPAARLTHGALLTPVRAAPGPPVDLGPDLQDRAVLVVDDDPAFRAVFARRLALDARRVEVVGDARSALLLLESGRWDLVCIDEGLPDCSGRQLAAEIRGQGLAGAVILVSGAATGPDDPLLLTAGVDAVLPQPCSDRELARAVRTASARHAERLAALA